MRTDILKFKFYHEDTSLYPDGIVTEFCGTFKVFTDEDGEQMELERLFINGLEDFKPPIHGNHAREKFLAELESKCLEQCSKCDQDRITLPFEITETIPHNLRPSARIAAIKDAGLPGESGTLVVTAHPSNAREIELVEFEMIQP